MMLTSDGHKKSMFGEMIFGSVIAQIRFGLAKTIPTMGLTLYETKNSCRLNIARR